MENMNKEDLRIPLTDEVSPDLIEMMGSEKFDSIPEINGIDLSKDISLREDISEIGKLSRINEIEELVAISPEYMERTAFMLYQAISVAAKNYNKKWFAIHEYTQVWKRELSSLKYSNKSKEEFIPITYSLWARKYLNLAFEDEVLVQYQPTSQEAIIQASYKLGFLDSIDYKALIKRFPIRTIEELSKQAQYMQRVREILKLQEHKLQALKKKVFPRIKERWIQEIELKINTMKGAL